MHAAIQMAAEQWWSKAGDDTAADWLIVALYALAAAAALRAGWGHRAGRSAWLGLGVGLLLFGVNKQLDLQTLLTALGRAVARSDGPLGGWYQGRRGVQMAFMLVVLIAGATALACAAWRLRGRRSTLQLAAAGAVVLCVFYALRMGSFHHTDHMLSAALVDGAIKLRHLLEAAGLLVILGAAAAELAWQRRHRRAPSASDG